MKKLLEIALSDRDEKYLLNIILFQANRNRKRTRKTKQRSKKKSEINVATRLGGAGVRP